jgi:hypothetical protein
MDAVDVIGVSPSLTRLGDRKVKLGRCGRYQLRGTELLLTVMILFR